MALLVERGIVTGQKAERFKMQDLQLTLQMLEMLLDPESGQHEPEPAGEPQKVREHERRPHRRAPLSMPDRTRVNLPRGAGERRG